MKYKGSVLKVEKIENNGIDINLHDKIVRVYNKKILGSKVLFIGLALITDTALILKVIEHRLSPNTILTSKDYAVFVGVLLALIGVNIAIAAEYIIVPRNIKKNRLKCITAPVTRPKNFLANKQGNKSEFFARYEVHYEDDVFELACAEEYEKISKGEAVKLIYVKSAFSKKYTPLMVYLPDEKGLDYELLDKKPCTYEQFTSGVNAGADANGESPAENYHDDLEGSKTNKLTELEEQLAKAPAGSKEQFRIMEQIGVERHRIKKSVAKSNRMQKIKEIIAIIRR